MRVGKGMNLFQPKGGFSDAGLKDVGLDDAGMEDLTSTPKRGRPTGTKRVKGMEVACSNNSSNSLDPAESGDEESEVKDMALGSSCITSGSKGDTDSSTEDREMKKPRLDLDQSKAESEVSEGQEVIDNASMADVTRTEDGASSGI